MLAILYLFLRWLAPTVVSPLLPGTDITGMNHLVCDCFLPNIPYFSWGQLRLLLNSLLEEAGLDFLLLLAPLPLGLQVCSIVLSLQLCLCKVLL